MLMSLPKEFAALHICRLVHRVLVSLLRGLHNGFEERGWNLRAVDQESTLNGRLIARETPLHVAFPFNEMPGFCSGVARGSIPVRREEISRASSYRRNGFRARLPF